MSLFARLRRRRLRKQALIAEPAWGETVGALPVLDGLDGEDLARMRRLATLFIHDKIFEAAGGLVLDDRMRRLIAALASLPILNLGYEWYEGWRTVIVYPGRFTRPRSQFDSIGVMHEWNDVLSGESWEWGPVVLSWADVEASGLGDGYNVVIHEMAHKLDMRNGRPDGFPPLPRDIPRHVWTEAFTTAFESLHARVSRGEWTAIDPYAAEEPGEFFAVLSEYFFEQPLVVRREYPAVYELLGRFYRQDPAGRPLSPSPSGRGLG